MDQETTQQFVRFCTSPNREDFLALMKLVVESPVYDPYGDDLRQLQAMFESNQYQSLVKRAYELMPGWLLSPRLHLMIAMSYARLGDEKSAQCEGLIGRACAMGIQSTGDGSQASPYLVCAASDEYDLLIVLGKEMTSQRLVHADDGQKFYDVLSCQDGTEIWFDVSAPFAWLQRQRQAQE